MSEWHQRDRSIGVVLLVVAIIAVTAVLGVLGFRKYMRDEKQKASVRQAAEEHNQAMQDARRRKQELEDELQELEEKSQIDIRDKGSILFLVTEPDIMAYTETRRIIEDAGFTGVIAVSDDRFPGDEGCMSVDELKKMAAGGWDVAVTSTAVTDVKALYQRAKAAGLEPTGIYFPEKKEDPDAEKKAKDLGIRTLFSYASEEPTEDPLLLRILTLGCNESGIKSVTEDYIAASGTIALCIGYSSARELYQKNSVTNMVSFIKHNTDENRTRVVGVEEAVSRKEEITRLEEEAKRSTQDRRVVLEAKIEELDRILLAGEEAEEITADMVVAQAESETTEPEVIVIDLGSSEEMTAATTAATTAAASVPETETETVTETSPEAAKKTESETAETKKGVDQTKPAVAETKPAPVIVEEWTTAAEETEPETTAAKKKKGKTPASPPPPEIEETPGDVYVEMEPETPAPVWITEKEAQSGTNWPRAEYITEPAQGPARASTEQATGQ